MLIVVGPVEAEAHAGRSHPERPERIGAVMRGVEDLHLGSDLSVLPTRSADLAELQRVHTAQYLEELRRHCAGGGGSSRPRHLRHAGIVGGGPPVGRRRPGGGGGATEGR